MNTGAPGSADGPNPESNFFELRAGFFKFFQEKHPGEKYANVPCPPYAIFQVIPSYQPVPERTAEEFRGERAAHDQNGAAEHN